MGARQLVVQETLEMNDDGTNIFPVINPHHHVKIQHHRLGAEMILFRPGFKMFGGLFPM